MKVMKKGRLLHCFHHHWLRKSFVTGLFSLFMSMSISAHAHWLIEAESPSTRVLLRNDTLDITAPQGLSLWWDQPMKAPCIIQYQACVVLENDPFDRLSDLNCFWMASLPSTPLASSVAPPSRLSSAHPVPSVAPLSLPSSAPPVQYVATESQLPPPPQQPLTSPLPSISQRKGRFVQSYRLQCYYLGYGGNYNTTTRFRRYQGDTLAVTDPSRRPPILKEYTDSAHLLKPNHWYDIRIEVHSDGRTRFYIDDELLVDYHDPSPLLHGWFAFRTTWSHIRLTAFRVTH